MILASCSYMLSPTIKSLMDNGVPFSNTYRPKRGDWNPLQKKAKMIARIMAYLKYSLKDGINSIPWNTHDIALWASAMKIKDGLIKRGASKVLEMWGHSEFAYRISSAEALMEIFEEDEVIRLVTTEPDIDWWYNQLKNEYQESANYPLRIAQLYGKDTLNAKPKLTVGTIHSVKGGEAEVVIVMPDLSKKGMNEWNGTEEERDSIRRVFYVGATRASETLILASPASAMAIDWEM